VRDNVLCDVARRYTTARENSLYSLANGESRKITLYFVSYRAVRAKLLSEITTSVVRCCSRCRIRRARDPESSLRL